MDRSNKKRISHVGHPIISREKSDIMTDVVADIIKKMDSSISDSEFYKILNTRTSERSSSQSNLNMPSAFPTQPSIASQKQRKFLANKRHPLMEKAQKSKNYIKHNRSLPKPRAHLSGFEDSVQKKKDEIVIKKSFSSSNSKKSCGSSHLEKTRKSSGAFAKSRQSRSNGDNNTIISDENVSDVSSKLPLSSSDSESDFESFIQAHKNDTELDGKRNRKKRKKGTKRKTLKQTKCNKNKKPKSIELESKDKESLPGSRISCKVTATNRRKLPETSDSSVSSADENESSSSFFETRKASSATNRRKLPETSNSSLSSADENESTNGFFKTGKSNSTTNRQKLLEKSNSSVTSADENESSKSFFETGKTSAIKVTSTNRQKLPVRSDCSVPSADENESGNSFFESEKDSSISCFENEYSNTNELCKQSVSDNFMCTVRIERNPHLDKAVTQSNPPLEEIYDFSSQSQVSKEDIMTECNIETTLDSDDDCMIVCEVPKSDDHANICVAGGSGLESDIQILNVVSLGESRKVIDTNDRNTVSLTGSFSRDENSLGVNFESSKKVIKATQGSNFFAPQEKTLITELNHSNPNFAANITGGGMQDITDDNFNKKVNPPVSTDVINTVNKIDFKQILLLANSASNNKSSPDLKVFDPLPCSSSSADSSFSCLPSTKSEIITEKHWQNLKKAVGVNNYSTNDLRAILEHLKSDSVNFNHIKPENNTNSLENEDNSSKEPSTIVPKCNLSASALKEIISNAEQLSRTNGENSHNEDYNEDPCEELDILGATSIRELCPNESSQNISRLLRAYSKKLQEYNEMKNSEEMIYSLKLLQDSVEAKRKNLETVLEQLMKKDPCFYTTAKNQETVNYNKTSSIQNIENEEVSSKQVKNCDNCGSKATIVCEKCNKVYFCTEKCGVFYWENGHYKSCEGTR